MERHNEKRFHQLTLAIQKAINSVETPVKEKHVRSTIIGTFQEQSAITYWMVAVRQPLQENRIVAWKFCHVTHKLLREGHPACLDDSQRHVPMIENLGKLWVHLREGYGRLVHLYCALLATKLKFHARNPRLPGNLAITSDELDNIAEGDVNNYFQLCVELYDYMDDILTLQEAVFDSLGNARANSMTASGQCRLAALIPCAQDASQIYDCNVRLMFRLHAALSADILTGHRERFRQQFKKLSWFYKHASSLQYYRNLLSLPVLPANPPNFLLQSELGTYVTPVVRVPEPRDEPDHVAALIDTSDTISQATTPDLVETFDTRTTPSPQPDPIVERDRLIDHLQNELKRFRAEVSSVVAERNAALASLRDQCARLETRLQEAQSHLEEERRKAESLFAHTPELEKRLKETEDRGAVVEEKFQKLKGAYTQLREEHITLIRQKAEVDKASARLRATAAQQESARAALQQQLNDSHKDVELLQQSASSSEEIEAYKSEISNLRSELDAMRQKETEIETLRGALEALQIEHNTANTEQLEKITTISNELKEVVENAERYKVEKEEREVELTKVRQELDKAREKSGEDYKRVLEDKEKLMKQLTDLEHQYQKEKEMMEVRLDHTERERLNAECELQDLLQHNTVLEADLVAARRQLDDLRADAEKQRTKLVNSVSEAAVEVTSEALSWLERGDAQEHSRAAAERAARALEELAVSVQLNGKEEAISRSAVWSAHGAAQVASYAREVGGGCTDLATADRLNTECRTMLTTTKQCLEALRAGTLEKGPCFEARSQLQALVARAGAAEGAPGGRSVDDELADMDSEIEQAASQIEDMLAANRSSDPGVKLEVNEKILDACTSLMNAVKVLVQDARKLQNELGDPKTRQKMYRKNPQWSEGLISAAKAVVFAAKLLVTSADEAVRSSGKVEGVSAAAHEVAGSTAQLVAASRARAPPSAHATALNALTAASRQVAAAVGGVVAAVRGGQALVRDHDALDTSTLTLTATRILEMESKVRSLELESALEAERGRLAALRKRHYQLAQQEENGNMTNGKQ